ncbi:DUF4184 family protein [Flavobacterium sp. JAS]|uniref:DUF4184 family protein n=1 Tax=Flavobacterium sp. JAS TaxID=2897329 RepID=UPI001E2AF956|nr:DUF4184 family protein [Flavobacterium sp. JAS]MCD0471170.1 DUF4184 family protein [Flavobacterium sp. JAS]
MPFTFSHPAIVLPLRYLPSKWLSLTGLVIGSITPDFEYFIRMKVQSNYSHTFYGIFWFDLPLAILLSFIFHNFICDALFYNLPDFIKQRVIDYTSFDWNTHFKQNWIIILISIIIGIASHLLWDGFTHNHGYFVDQIPLLKNNFIVFGNEIPIWKIAQHLSTLIGGIVIVIALLKLPKSKIQKPFNYKKYWITIIICTIIISILRFFIHFNIKAFGNIFVTLISAFLISLILTPLLIKFRVSQKI